MFPPVIEDQKWWKHNVLNSLSVIKSNPEIDYIIYADANIKDWGPYDNNETINGRWLDYAAQSHFNVLELTAIKFAIRSFLSLKHNMKNFRIITDNSTAICYINKQGGMNSMTCNDISKQTWEFCFQKRVHI